MQADAKLFLILAFNCEHAQQSESAFELKYQIVTWNKHTLTTD